MLVCPACRLVLSASFCGVHGVEGDPADLDALHAALSGKFRVSGAYAVGDTGTLYAAEELTTKRQGLLKILRVRDDAGRDALERLVTEIQNQTVLSHSSFLVPIRRAGLDDGVPWLFRDFVPGESLKSRLARTGKMSLSDALVLAAQVATALHDLHSRGLVHRALRPGHVLLRDDAAGTAHALVIEASMAGRNDRTSPLEDLGDLFYMPPEVARGEKVGFRSDLYALGCTLYDALMGAPPFDGDSADEVVNGHLYTAPWVPRDTLPAQIASLLEHLLAKAPFDRPSSAKEVIREIEPYLPPDWQMPPHETAKSAQAIAVAVPAARVSAPPPVPALRASAMPPPVSAMPPRASSMPPPVSAMPPRASSMPPPASAMPPRASSMPPPPASAMPPRASSMPPQPPPRPSAMPPAQTVPAKILAAAPHAPDPTGPIPLDPARAKKPTPWPAARPSASSPALPPPAPLPFERDHDISSIMPTEIDVTDDFPPVRAGRRFPRGTAGFVLGCAATMAATWALAYTGNFHVVTETLTTHLAVPESNLDNGVHAASASLAPTASTPALTATAPTTAPAPAPAADTDATATETAGAADTEPATEAEAATAAATETATATEAEAPAEADTDASATETAAAADDSARTEPAERPRRMSRAERLRALRQARIERRRQIREARLERRRQRIRARIRAQRREAAREARAARAGSGSSSGRSGGSVDDFLL